MSTQRIELRNLEFAARLAEETVATVFSQHAEAIAALGEVARIAKIEKQLRVIADSQKVIEDARATIALLEKQAEDDA